ncbi:MAG: dipeptidase [Candidatus Aminicenantes bacterium]|nr:dipeptidase [Candidatus Aminicenantes bacterium]
MKKKAGPDPSRDILIFDAHCDTASVLLDLPWSFRRSPAHLDLSKARKGGLQAQVFAIWVDPLFAPHRALHRGLRVLQAMEQKVFVPKLAMKVTTVAEMDAAVADGRLAAWLFLEGGHIIENSPELLAVFHSLGVRGMTLTHGRNTDWADSSTDTPRVRGLTALGRRIVSQMEQTGMAIDLSHVSDASARAVLRAVSAPVMASHSNARKLCAVPRNLTDDLIRAIAASGGFIGANFHPAFIQRRVYEQIEANFAGYAREMKERAKGHRDDPDFLSRMEWEYFQRAVKGNAAVTLSEMLDHIVHIASLGGIDCVGLGSDFDGIASTPVDLKNAAAYPALVAGLKRRGFRRDEIRKVCGLNLKRFLHRVERRRGRA